LQYVEILTSCIRLAAVACAAILPPDMPVVAVVLSVFSRPHISKNFFRRAIAVSSVLVAFRAASCTLAPGIHLRVARKNARRFRPFISA